MNASEPIEFAEKLLSLLDTGSFTTTYKYALLLAMFDAALEGTDADGAAPTVLHGRALGRRVFELYWRQARPYSSDGILRQSAQNDIVTKIHTMRTRLGISDDTPLEVARLQHPDAIASLEADAVTTVIRFPIPLLQRFGAGGTWVEDRFIYEIGWDDSVTKGRIRRSDFDDRLHLRPGAGDALTAIAGLARPVVQREWIRHVARRNAEHVDELGVESFMFGAQRIALDRVRGSLLELQDGRCFYCERDRGPWEVDHFLPWSRWPDDRLDNLVVADRRCNNDKRSALAATDHLARWWERFTPDDVVDRQLASISQDCQWPRRPDRTAAGARGVYLHQPPGTMLWAALGSVEPLDAGHLRFVLDPPALAAEGAPDTGAWAAPRRTSTPGRREAGTPTTGAD